MEFNKKKLRELSNSDFLRIENIFKFKNWPIVEPFGDNVFDNFCNMLASMNSDECDLILSLTEKFLWVRESEYINCFSVVLDRFINSYDFHRGKKICFCPLLPERDFGMSKSSVAFIYKIKAYLTAIQNNYIDYSITYCDIPSSVDINIIMKDYTLCLIDDFIGTGETAEDAIQYFLDRGLKSEHFVILSLTGMEEGINRLKFKKYDVFTYKICNKGLSIYGNIDQIQLMQNIENKIKVKDKYKFGYGSSEALVRMMRTPNNTFPIYWVRNNKNRYAPFPR